MSRTNTLPSSETALILSPIRGSLLPQPPKEVVISKKELGRRLRAARQARGMTQVELAEALGTYQTVVSAIERGARGLTVQQVASSFEPRHLTRRHPRLGQPSDKRHSEGSPVPSSIREDRRLSKRDKQALLKNIDMFLKGAGVS